MVCVGFDGLGKVGEMRVAFGRDSAMYLGGGSLMKLAIRVATCTGFPRFILLLRQLLSWEIYRSSLDNKSHVFFCLLSRNNMN